MNQHRRPGSRPQHTRLANYLADNRIDQRRLPGSRRPTNHREHRRLELHQPRQQVVIQLIQHRLLLLPSLVGPHNLQRQPTPSQHTPQLHQRSNQSHSSLLSHQPLRQLRRSQLLFLVTAALSRVAIPTRYAGTTLSRAGIRRVSTIRRAVTSLIPGPTCSGTIYAVSTIHRALSGLARRLTRSGTTYRVSAAAVRSLTSRLIRSNRPRALAITWGSVARTISRVHTRLIGRAVDHRVVRSLITGLSSRLTSSGTLSRVSAIHRTASGLV